MGKMNGKKNLTKAAEKEDKHVTLCMEMLDD